MSESIHEDALYVTVADSWVRATKLSETSGKGDKKLYVGGDASGRISDFFGDDTVTAFIDSDEVLEYLTRHSSEFMNDTSKFRKGEELKDIYFKSVRALGKYPQGDIEFTIEKQEITGDRYYVNSDEDIYDHLRDILIPEQTILRITRVFDLELRFKFEILEMDDYERLSASSTEKRSSSNTCLDDLEDVWVDLEGNLPILDDFRTPFGLIKYYRQDELEGAYLGFDSKGNRMIMRRVVSQSEAKYFGDLVTAIIHEDDIEDLQSAIGFGTYSSDSLVLGIVYLINVEAKDHFNQLICKLVSEDVRIGKFLHSRSKLSSFHRRFNKQPSSITHREFRENPKEFLEYHLAYRQSRRGHLTTHEYLLDFLLRFHNDKAKIIADFGCGEAKLAQYLSRDDLRNTSGGTIDHTVINIDHYDFSKFTDIENPTPSSISIHEVDFADAEPLADVFGQISDDTKLLDIAIFSLSLWGEKPNPKIERSAITHGLLNAHKHLKPDGEIHIIESSSRLGMLRDEHLDEVISDESRNLNKFLRRLREIGFTVNEDKILEINNQQSSLYNASNHRFVHILGQKDRYNLRLRNNITEIASVFDTTEEETNQ